MTVPDRASGSEMFQLDRATCLALLTTQYVGRLVVAGDEPRVVPVNYVVHDGSVVFRGDHGAPGEGIDGHAVAFEVDMIDDRTRSGWSVIVRGSITTSTIDGTSGTGAPVRSWAAGPNDQRYEIDIGEVTGRLLRGSAVETSGTEHGYL